MTEAQRYTKRQLTQAVVHVVNEVHSVPFLSSSTIKPPILSAYVEDSLIRAQGRARRKNPEYFTKIARKGKVSAYDSRQVVAILSELYGLAQEKNRVLRHIIDEDVLVKTTERLENNPPKV